MCYFLCLETVTTDTPKRKKEINQTRTAQRTRRLVIDFGLRSTPLPIHSLQTLPTLALLYLPLHRHGRAQRACPSLSKCVVMRCFALDGDPLKPSNDLPPSLPVSLPIHTIRRGRCPWPRLRGRGSQTSCAAWCVPMLVCVCLAVWLAYLASRDSCRDSFHVFRTHHGHTCANGFPGYSWRSPRR